MLMIVLSGLISACVTAPAKPPAEHEQLIDAKVRAQTACGLRYVKETDDELSDAATVALALAIRCRTEYDAATEASVAYDNDRVKKMMRDKRGKRESLVEAYLPVVMKYRQSLKTR